MALITGVLFRRSAGTMRAAAERAALSIVRPCCVVVVVVVVPSWPLVCVCPVLGCSFSMRAELAALTCSEQSTVAAAVWAKAGVTARIDSAVLSARMVLVMVMVFPVQ